MTLGAAVGTYPVAGEWFTDLAQAGQIASFGKQLAERTPAETAAMLQAAHRYNEELPNGPLRDPYAVDADGSPIPVGAGKDAYEAALNPAGDGIMGVLRIPKIGVKLPIRHDTNDTVLDAGVGHLYGSALPVGGPSTHSVLTAHSGMVGARLFTDLDQLDTGDTFSVLVGDQTLTYRVDQITTVLPTELDELRQIPGGDYVTLVTCTPTGINSHRLLVRGVRIPTPSEDAEDASGLARQPGPGFPWWVFPVPAAALLLTAATRTGAGPPLVPKWLGVGVVFL
ncbi:class C sortase [Leucobacter massiliensis]|nr:class C sortase [Leucobacter massiliensis]